MQTELQPCTDGSIARAAELLAAGQPVAFPTETVYGLGARVDDAQAVRRIYAAKGRPESRPLIVHLRAATGAPSFAADWPAAAAMLARRFWPGPLTIVVPRAATVLDEVAAGGQTVALRVPAHPVAQRLLDACGCAVAAPSANRFGEPPPRSGQDVLRALDGRIPLVLDAGSLPPLHPSLPSVSTIVDLSCTPAQLLRVGAIPVADLRQLIELR